MFIFPWFKASWRKSELELAGTDLRYTTSDFYHAVARHFLCSLSPPGLHGLCFPPSRIILLSINYCTLHAFNAL